MGSQPGDQDSPVRVSNRCQKVVTVFPHCCMGPVLDVMLWKHRIFKTIIMRCNKCFLTHGIFKNFCINFINVKCIFIGYLGIELLVLLGDERCSAGTKITGEG